MPLSLESLPHTRPMPKRPALLPRLYPTLLVVKHHRSEQNPSGRSPTSRPLPDLADKRAGAQARTGPPATRPPPGLAGVRARGPSTSPLPLVRCSGLRWFFLVTVMLSSEGPSGRTRAFAEPGDQV